VLISGYNSSVGLDDELRSQVTHKQIEKAQKVMHYLGSQDLSVRTFDTLSTGQQRRCLLVGDIFQAIRLASTTSKRNTGKPACSDDSWTEIRLSRCSGGAVMISVSWAIRGSPGKYSWVVMDF